jgi:putative phosphoribosyl transferase
MSQTKPFRNRTDAGRQLARTLPAHLHDSDALVLALPRGGVPVGFAVARELGLELDILLVRKLGLPGHEEFAMGALGSGGVRVVQPALLRQLQVSEAVLDAVCAREQLEIERRERAFRGARPPPQLAGRNVILVDDGLATGATMRAAIEVARAGAPASIVVAVPVGAPDTCAVLAPEVDLLVCPLQPMRFMAVSKWYQHFEQTGDDEVQDLLALAWRTHPARRRATAAPTTIRTGGPHESSH